MPSQVQMVPGPETLDLKKVWYEGSDTIYNGYAVCYNHDYATDETMATRVEQPATANMKYFAGLVTGLPTIGRAGPTELTVVEPGSLGSVVLGWSALNTTINSTQLALQNGSYALAAAATGPVVATAMATNADLTATPAAVWVRLHPPGVKTYAPNALWDSCPLEAIRLDPNIGYEYFTDFIGADMQTGVATEEHGGWILTQATTGTWKADDAAGGVMLLDSASSTQRQGGNLQLGGTTGECFIPAAGKDIWFECRVKVADFTAGTTGPELAIGLANIDTTVIGTSAVSTTDHILFSSVSDDGVVLFNGENGGTGNTETFTTLADSTWARIGFHCAGVTTCQAYLNGAATGTALVTANIPILEMVPTFVCQSDGTVDPILHIDWLRIVQLR